MVGMDRWAKGPVSVLYGSVTVTIQSKAGHLIHLDILLLGRCEWKDTYHAKLQNWNKTLEMISKGKQSKSRGYVNPVWNLD